MSHVRFDPAGPFKRDPPPPHEMRDRHTATDNTIVLCHLGVPRLEPDRWSLTIDGLVERPVTLGFDDLLRYPKVQVAAVHECCGSPFEPFVPTRRVANVRWTGVRLADVLAECRPRETATYIWSYGADYGVFGGVSVDAYAKDLPLSRVRADVLIGYQLNGDALPAEHGYPARLVVPGFYGTNSVKWLRRITLADRRLASRLHLQVVSRPAVGRHGPSDRFDHAGLVDLAGVADRLTGGGRTDCPLDGMRNYGGGLGPTAGYPTSMSEPVTSGSRRAWSRRMVGSGNASGCVGRRCRREEWKLAARAVSARGVRQPLCGRRNAVHRISVAVN